MADGIERPQLDGFDLLAPQPGRARGPAAQGRGEGRGARPGIVGVALDRSAVAVVVAADRAMLLCMRRLGDAGGSGGTGDVGDRGDVIPVDPVADAEREAGRQDADTGRSGDIGRSRKQQFEHAFPFPSDPRQA